MASDIDWDALKNAFLVSNHTKLADFLQEKGMKRSGNVSRHTAGWPADKKAFMTRKNTRVLQKTLDRRVAKEVDHNLAHLQQWDIIRDFIDLMLQAPDASLCTADGQLTPAALEKIAGILDKAQRGQRLALGLDAGKQDKENNQLSELIASLRAQRPGGEAHVN